MSVIAGFFVPHPPIIIPEIGRGEENKIQDTVDAYQEVAKQIKELQPDTIIITSPHSISFRSHFNISISPKQQGDFRRFRAPKVSVQVTLDDDLTNRIIRHASEQNIPLGPSNTYNDELDHGSLVPLYFILNEYQDVTLVRISPSTFSPEKHYQTGQEISTIIPQNKRVVWVASGDLSHTLKADGPYGLTKEGPLFDQEFCRIVQELDVKGLFELQGQSVDKAAVCGLGSFAMMLGAFDGTHVQSTLLSYQDTFGVGYAVASFYPVKEESE